VEQASAFDGFSCAVGEDELGGEAVIAET